MAAELVLEAGEGCCTLGARGVITRTAHKAETVACRAVEDPERGVAGGIAGVERDEV